MPSVIQGMTQKLEAFTSQLKETEKNDVLRLHNGKIKKGDYKGTNWGQFFHWATSIFRTEKQKTARKAYLRQVTEDESRALAVELCKDISKRTPVPYQVAPRLRQINGHDATRILHRTRAEREQFSQIVQEVAATASTPTPLKTDVVDSAGERVHQSFMDRSIRRPEQLKQLQREVVETLDRKRADPESRSTLPLILKGSHYRALKTRLARKMEDKLLTLALFREAEEYATKQSLDLQSIRNRPSIEEAAIPVEKQRELVKSFVTSPPVVNRASKSVALLTAEYMLNHGFVVDDADLPDLSEEGAQEKIDKEIDELRDHNSYWTQEVANLLEQGKFKEAQVAKELARDAESLELLETLREDEADDAWDDYIEGQQQKLEAGEKLKTQSHDTKKLKERGPRLLRKRPQNVFDRARPSRGGLTQIASAFAKQTISGPIERDQSGPVDDWQVMVEQPLNMMRSKYKSFSEQHNTVLMTQLREYLEKNLRDRQVAVVNAVRYIDPLGGSEELEDTLVETNVTTEFPGKPVFDVGSMEAVETDSGRSSMTSVHSEDLLRTLDKNVEDDVFTEEMPVPPGQKTDGDGDGTI